MKETFRYPHVNFLSDLMILKVLHKFIDVLEYNNLRIITMITNSYMKYGI